MAREERSGGYSDLGPCPGARSIDLAFLGTNGVITSPLIDLTRLYPQRLRSEPLICATMSSRLLKLPRELRDLIYGYVLVCDVIPVQSAAVLLEAPAFRSTRGLEKAYPLRRLRAHRRIWLTPRFDIGLTSAEYDSRDGPTNIRMTYQLAIPSDTSSNHIEIRLLQTCRQIYHEARKVFYGQNIFSFTESLSIPTAFAFLCDRPAESLKLISSMELALVEASNMRGTIGAHYPVLRRSTDSLVLQFAYNHFTDLCTLLSTTRMGLRRLHLVISSSHQRYDTAPSSAEECFLWEAQMTVGPRPWVASWIEPLLKVETLEHLNVHWNFDRPRLRRVADTISYMRCHMLAEPRSKLADGSGSCVDSRLDFQVHYRVAVQNGISISREFSRKEMFNSDCESEDDRFRSSEKDLTTAWQRQVRETFKASGCL